MENKPKFKVHVRRDEEVVVITGKDKGKQGKVKKVLPKTGRVVVEGVNMVKKHTKPSAKNMQGGIMEMEAPIHSSNVMSLEKIKAKKATKNG
ncbi:MAG TPA: 50S ribosomal protein L24 [Symbiobacteriaceae bacterium]|nr:50S ribosomal protein L24 [Symbiobacteriaceae bacterium]